jgi:hypothetical protein
MIFLKNKLHFLHFTPQINFMYLWYRNASLLALLISSLFFTAHEVKSAEVYSEKQSQEQSQEQPQEQICPTLKLRAIRSFETDRYHMYICRGERAGSLGYYVRIPKQMGSKITVPVSQKNGENYIAANKDEITYVINPYQSVVVKKGRVILKEKVNIANKGDGSVLISGCSEGENTFVEAETKSFAVYICGGDAPTSYVTITKSGNKKVILTLVGYNSADEMNKGEYVALNENILFFLTQHSLKISQDGQTIVEEKILRWN